MHIPAAPHLRVVAVYMMILVFMIGLMIIAGWWFDIKWLIQPSDEVVPMNPLSAICFMLIGLSLYLQRSSVPQSKFEKNTVITIGLLIALIGFAKIASLILGFNFYFDTILFRERLWDPVRDSYKEMSPNAAFCFFVIGIGISILDLEIKQHRPSQYAAAAVIFVALLCLYGYGLEANILYGFAGFLPMSIWSGIAFFIASLAILLMRPATGFMVAIISDASPGTIGLRISAFVIPLLMGWMELEGERSGLFTHEYGTALYAVFTYAITMFLLGIRSVANHRLKLVKIEAERAFKENALKLQSILDHTPTPVYIKNLSGEYELVNKEFEKLLQVSATAVIGKRDDLIFSPQISERNKEAERQVLDSSSTIYNEEHLTLNEDEYYFLTARFPLIDTTGKAHAVCSISTNITERKRLEDSLRESEQRYHSMVEQVEDYSILRLDRNGVVESWNEGIEKITGYKEGEIKGQHLRILYSKEDQVKKLPEDHIHEAIEKGRASSEGWRMRKDGTAFWATSVLTALYDDTYKINGFSEVTRDITSRKVAEVKLKQISERLKQKTEQLIQSENFYHSMVEQMEDYSILRLDEKGLVESWNEGVLKLYGYDEDEIVGHNFELFFIMEDEPETPGNLKEEAKTKGTATFEGWQVRKDRSSFWASSIITAIHHEENGIAGFSMVTHDLTNRKLAEVKLKQISERLRQKTGELMENQLLLESVLNNIGDAVVVLDVNGEFEILNKKAKDLIGGKLHGNFIDTIERLDLFLADKSTKVPIRKFDLKKLFHNNTESEILWLRKKNRWFQLQWIVHRIQDQSGEIIAIMQIFREVRV